MAIAGVLRILIVEYGDRSNQTLFPENLPGHLPNMPTIIPNILLVYKLDLF